MVGNNELSRVPGIRAVSSFYDNFEGEDVVIRPVSPDQDPFKIEVLLNSGKAIFPPAAPVHEGDLVEREDPRGGVIEYAISRFEFNKDPFGDDTDHWDATLTEKGHAARTFAQPKIIIHGGTNQIAVGNSNQLQQSNPTFATRELIAALDEIEKSIPRDAVDADQLEAVEEAIAAVRDAASTATKPTSVKRAIYGVRGIVDEVGSSAKSGVKDGVKVWVASATTLLIKQLIGL